MQQNDEKLQLQDKKLQQNEWPVSVLLKLQNPEVLKAIFLGHLSKSIEIQQHHRVCQNKVPRLEHFQLDKLYSMQLFYTPAIGGAS